MEKKMETKLLFKGLVFGVGGFPKSGYLFGGSLQ